MFESITNLLQWLVVSAFFLLVIGFNFAEASWLKRKGWASFGKGFAFSAATNLIGFSAGLIVFIAAAIILLAATWDGLSYRKVSDAGFIAVLVFGMLFTPFLLLVCKRLMLALLKMQSGKPAWLYSLASSLLIFFVSVGVPGVTGYFIFR